MMGMLDVLYYFLDLQCGLIAHKAIELPVNFSLHGIPTKKKPHQRNNDQQHGTKRKNGVIAERSTQLKCIVVNKTNTGVFKKRQEAFQLFHNGMLWMGNTR